MEPLPHTFLFEFMDLPWLPDSLRTTVREVLESCLGEPPRQYYSWVVDEILELVERHRITTVVELGAGTAPLARRLAKTRGSQSFKIEVSDLYPNVETFRLLEQEFPGVVLPCYDSVDVSQPIAAKPSTLLVFSASFHHLPPVTREAVLGVLRSHRVAVFEPLRRNIPSVLVSLTGLFPGLLAPFYYWRKRPGNARRFFWSWILPAAPLIIVWDGVVSCLRCWKEIEWRRKLSITPDATESVSIKNSTLCQMISW